MFIDTVTIQNFKCFRNNTIKFTMPDRNNPGSGLNVMVGDNNSGKSTIFEIIKKTKEKLIDPQEIHYKAQINRKECFANICSNESKSIEFRSKHYEAEDPNHNIEFIKNDFQPNFYHANVARIVMKHTDYGSLNSRVGDAKIENSATKQDTYQIIQEMHALNREQRNEFCALVNSFLPQIKRVFVRSDRRANFARLTCKLKDDTEIDLLDMGSGIEQFIILLWIVKHGTQQIILIDEPEISLHPQAQMQLSKLLVDLSKDKQIIIATHSPYFFKECLNYNSPRFLIFKLSKSGNAQVENAQGGEWGLFPWSPSWGEINYFAFGLPTVEFHDELYGFLHERYISGSKNQMQARKRSEQIYFDRNYLQRKINSAIRKWTPELGGVIQAERSITLQTFIRNKVHHPENKTMRSAKFTGKEMQRSIKEMVNAI